MENKDASPHDKPVRVTGVAVAHSAVAAGSPLFSGMYFGGGTQHVNSSAIHSMGKNAGPNVFNTSNTKGQLTSLKFANQQNFKMNSNGWPGNPGYTSCGIGYGTVSNASFTAPVSLSTPTVTASAPVIPAIPPAPALPTMLNGSRITLSFSAPQGPQAGTAVLVINDQSTEIAVVNWQANSVTLQLPQLMVSEPLPAAVSVSKASGPVVQGVQATLLRNSQI